MHRICTVLAIIATAGAVMAAPAAPRDLTFEQALGEGAQLPELVGWARSADVLDRTPVPGGWSPLLVTLGIGPRLAPASERGLEGGISLQQPIPLGDPGHARRATRDAVAARARAMATALTLDTRLAIAEAWIQSWAAGERLASAERDLALARSIGEAMVRGRQAGVFTAPELADARAFVAEAVARKIDAEGSVADTSFALAAALGRTGRARAVGALPAPEVTAPAEREALVARAQQLPAVAARRLAARADRARALEERALRGHQLVVGAEVRRDGPGALTAIASLGITLPHDRGQREAAFAEAGARILDGEAETLAIRGALELERTLHEVEHTREMLDALVEGLVPAADLAASSRARAFDVGETTVVELLASQRTSLAAHARVADARAAHAWARVRAWLLVETAEVAR